MHLDMDAFFAAIEQTIHPALRGKPVIIGGPADSRGVVSTCSYEARNYGIHSAMPMKKAHQLCPDGIYIDTSGDKYSYMSAEVMKILRAFSPIVEPVSIDESFVDITGIWERYGGMEKLAFSIKDEIRHRLDLTASIGIAPNRFVAKMASSSNKPNGLVIIPPDQVQQFLWGQPVEHLWGVGPKSAEAMKKYGINTISDLAKTSKAQMKNMFGIVGEALIGMANGKGEDKVRASHEEGDTKSMGHEHTFHRDTKDPDRILSLLLYLSDKVARRLRLHDYEGRTVNLKIRKSDFKLVTRAISYNVYINNEQEIFKAAKNLLLENRFLDHPIRLIGVNISNLRKRQAENYDEYLIDYEPVKKSKKIDEVIDKLREIHGEEAITFAGTKLD